NYGTLANATLVLDGGTLGLDVSTFQADTIEGVLTIGDGDTVVVQGGFSITGIDGTSPGTIALTGADSTLEVADAETLNATTITIGNADDVSTLQVDSTLTLGSGSVIQTTSGFVSDAITGAGSVINNGAIVADAAAGTLIIGTTDFTNDGLLSVASGADLQIQPFDAFINAGTLSVASGSLATIESVNTFSNTGAIVVNGGSLQVFADLQGSGGVTSLSDGAQVELGASAAAGQDIQFLDGTDSLVLDDAADFASTVAGFQQGDSIVLTGFGGASETYADGVVTITQSSSVLGIPITTVATIQMEGDYTANDFSTTTDASGDLILTVDVLPCFAAGTRIMTAEGEVAVEALKAGDRVVTVTTGKRRMRPIVWVGHRAVDISRHPAPEKVRPVRVQRGAFAPNLPARDLLLSPDHAIYAEGVLVPVKYLINGTTIRVDETAQHVVYHHVQLAQHEILLSEGLRTESYLESGGRGMFANGGQPIVLHADFSHIAWDVLGCAPLKVTGSEVERIKAHLAKRAKPARAVRGKSKSLRASSGC
ncbi:Hint domain-containing protein, partial [Acidisoma cellulosilytica]